MYTDSINRVLDYIEEHLTDEISYSTLAGMMATVFVVKTIQDFVNVVKAVPSWIGFATAATQANTTATGVNTGAVAGQSAAVGTNTGAIIAETNGTAEVLVADDDGLWQIDRGGSAERIAQASGAAAQPRRVGVESVAAWVGACLWALWPAH